MRLDPNLYRNLKRYHIVRFSHWEPDAVEKRIKQVMTKLRSVSDEERDTYSLDLEMFFEANGFDEEFFKKQPKHPQSLEERAEVQRLVAEHQQRQEKAAEVAAFRKKHPEIEAQVRKQIEAEMRKHVGHSQ